MKRVLLPLIVFFATLTSQAQNWQLFNPNEMYHYSFADSNKYAYSLKVDSMSVSGTDTIYHFNRIAFVADTNSTFLAINQALYGERKAKKLSAEEWIFFEPDTVYFNLKDSVGMHWQYKTGIGADYIKKDSMSFLGISDSVRWIVLSTNDTLLLSKNYGIIRFVNYYFNPFDSLKREFTIYGEQQAALGFHLPTWKDVFNYSIGDSFCIHGSPDQNPVEEHSFTTFNENQFILDKHEFDDSIVYYVRENHQYHIDFFYGPPYSYDHTSGGNINRIITVNDFPFNLLSRGTFIHHYIALTDGLLSSGSVPTSYDSTYNVLDIIEEDSFLLIKNQIETFDGVFMASTPIPNIIKLNPGMSISYDFVYKTGSGFILNQFSNFENGFDYTKDAYTSSCKIYVGIDEITSPEVKVFPTIVDDLLQIESNEPIQSILISNVMGELEMNTTEKNIDVRTLSKGMHLLQIHSGEAVQIHKFIKR